MVPNQMISTQENSPCRQREGSSRQNDKKITHPSNRRPPRDHWGHIMRKKKEKMIRIVFVNINRIGLYARDPKSEDLRQFIQEKQIDVMGIVETNVHWGKVHAYHTL